MKWWPVLLAGMFIWVGCVVNNPAAPVPVGVEVGNQAPDFSMPNVNGETVTLSQFRGSQNVVLVFHTGSL